MRKLAFCQQRKPYQKKKLRYLHRLLSGNGKKLAKQVYEVQKDLELPKGWEAEMRTILEKYDLQHLDKTDIGKMEKH